jgi:integral membrane protein (TIGR01906 family)
MTTAENAPANKATSPLYRALSWLVALLVPIALTLTFVRLMLSPFYINIEYRLPGFPVDPYGFTNAQRLYYGNIARLYLLNSAGISYLGDLQFENGQPFYNERELQHMVDVKKVVKAALNVWIAALVFLLGLGIWAWFGHWWPDYTHGLSRGGWLTVILLGVILVLVVISFNLVFVVFHEVFFAAGSWTFNFSDTLIRLFPERFWRDIFIWVGGLTLISGLALGILFRRKS